jgi:beta-glucosidase
MRLCSSPHQVIFSTGLLALLTLGCGHSAVENPKTGGAGGSTSTGGSGGQNPNNGGATMGGNTTGGSTPGGSAKGGAPAGGTTSGGGTMGGTTSTTPGECAASTLPEDPARPGYTADRDPEVASLLTSMSLEAKIKQLYGIPNPANRDGSVYNDIERSQDVEISGKTLRGYRYRDAGRGVNLAAGQDNRASKGKNYSTAFPCPSIRASSWDVALEKRVGQALGDETMGSNNNMMLAPCMNIIRHPFWGRTQETYSEDMFHTGRLASALTAGIQQHVVACAKHFAANNVENNRSDQNAVMDEQTLREIYGRHFEMVVREGGIGCIMAAYNSVNGVKSTQSKHLLTDILRGPVDKGGFGFRGIVLTDWWAMPGFQITPDTATAQRIAAEALKAGVEIELPWALNYSQLGALVTNQTLTQADIDTAAGRVLEQKFRFKTAYTDSPWGLGTAKTSLAEDSITKNDDHLALAEEAEIKSAVLLSNGTADSPVLPIKTAKSIAVVGMDVEVKVSGSTEPPTTGTRLKFASDVNIGDRGSSRVNIDLAKSIGPFAGIQTAAVAHSMSASSVTTGTDAAAAKDAEFVVVVVGLTAGDEGEEYSVNSLGDRKSLSIGPAQENFVKSVLDLNKPTAIIVESGSIVALPWLSHSNKNQATIWAGYGGQRQGAAFGKLLFGDANFSGKMALAWPKESDLPPFTTSERSTKMDYFFGYRYYDKQKLSGNLVFPFGWGMSYSKFEYVSLATLTPSCTGTTKNNVVTYVADIKNSSSVDGEEVVMLFVSGPPNPAGITGNRPVKELKSFAKVKVPAGQTVKVNLPLNIQDLRHWEGDDKGKNVIDNGEYTILVGPNASEAALTLKAKLNVHD